MTEERAAEQKPVNYIIDIKPGTAYEFMFTNYKTARSERHVIARSLQWGGTPWHPQLQWFLHGLDLDKLEPRSFPLKEIELRSFRAMTDSEVDVYFTKLIQAAKEAGHAAGLADAEALVLKAAGNDQP